MSVFDSIANTIGTVLGVLFDGVQQVVNGIKKGYDAYRRRGGVTEDAAKSVVEAKKDRLREVNDEIMALRNRAMGGQGLSDVQRRRWTALKEEREQLLAEVNEARQAGAAETILAAEDRIQKVEIELETSHVLQWNAFADILGKNCPRCARRGIVRPMKVQWQRKLQSPGPNDFYWGCTGWYVILKQPNGNDVLQPNGKPARDCEYTEKLSRNDYGLMTDTSEPEFAVSADEFETILTDRDTQQIIVERMDDLRSDLASAKRGVEIASCPVHGMNMVLRRKSKPTGLLDTYFLACPYWKQDDAGCSFMEKLKSGAQLAALLKSQTGRGVL